MADVSSAFANTPQNPNLPPASQPAANLDVTPPQPTNTIAPQPLPQPQPAPEPAPQPTQTAQQPQPAPVDPNLVWQQLQHQQQFNALQQQNAQLTKQLHDQNATIDNLLKYQQDYDALKKQAAANQELNFGELDTIDPNDAKKIGAAIMQAVSAQMTPLQQQLQQQAQQVQQANQWQEQRFIQQQARGTLDKIIAAHPDFLALQNDPGYQQFVQQRDGYSSKSRDMRAAEEFRVGNADYINNMISQYKATKPQPANITSVAPVQTATAPVQPQPPLPPTQHTLRELNDLLAMRQITPDQYRAEVAQVRAAFLAQQPR